ncbi:MAG TPA: TonB family protein [Xanthobacteraceae bacterium]|nr:TonB family protein [Xanthobacteraceae bacterium]
MRRATAMRLFAKFHQVATRGADPERKAPPDLILPASAGSNVVPFARPHRDGARDPPPVTAEIGSRGPPSRSDSAALWGGVFTASLFVHGAVLAVLLSRPPEPLAGIELPAISVDLVFGADSPAGLASAPSQAENSDAPAERQKPPVEEPTSPPEPPATQPEASPPTTASEPVAKPQATASTEPDPAPPPAATVEPPPLPPEPAAKAEPEAPPVSEPKPTEPAPKQKARPTRSSSHERHANERQTSEHRTNERTAKHARTKLAHNNVPASQEPASRRAQAGGVGRGRSPADPNYYGLVAAHLARYKQFPADARNAHSQGSATVTFNLDGHGRVTSVALVRGTGVASLDREAQAMVHRASPFPPPPGGNSMKFTVPVSFQIR